MERNGNIDISIIVPIYNAEKYLSRCIDSIRRQSYNNYEVILINDGSTDDSEKICLAYEREDSRVRYIRQENAGVAAARNYGIKNARGKYVALLDNDDYFNYDFLKQIMVHDEQNADILLFQYINVTGEHTKKQEQVVLEKICTESLVKKGEYLQREMFCPTSEAIKQSTIVFPWGKAYRREFLLENGIHFDSRIKLCEDVYFNLKAYEHAEKVLYVHYPAYFYFQNIHSAGKGFNPKVVEMEEYNIRLLDEFVNAKPRNKEYMKAYDNCLCFRYWSCCFSYFVHPQNTKKIRQITQEMKEFERRTNIRRAFKTLPKIRKSMEKKEWIFLMAVKYHFYVPMLLVARKKMKLSRG